jgi:hypothetical protein
MDIEKENLAGMSEYTSIERRLTELISDYKDGIYEK